MPEERELADRRRRADVTEFKVDVRSLSRSDISGVGSLSDILCQDQVVILNPIESEDDGDYSREIKMLHIVGSCSLGRMIYPRVSEETNQLISE